MGPKSENTYWQQIILSKIEDLVKDSNKRQEKIDERLLAIIIDVTELKIKAGLWGFFAGLIPAVIAVGSANLKK